MQSLLSYNTFGIDQSCKKIYEPETIDDLHNILATIKKDPLLIIGGGSNLLLTKDFEGNVLHLKIKGIEATPYSQEQNSVLLRCGAGETWDDIVVYAVSHGYYGIENLSIIPGEVGASAVQNIGAYGIEVKDYIYQIEAIEIESGNEVMIHPENCDYAYRYSRFKNEWKGKYVITYVTYKLKTVFTPYTQYGNIQNILTQKGITNPTAKDIRDAIIDVRNAKLPDPKVEGNAGSFFINPIIPKEKFKELLNQYPDMPHYNVSENKEKIPAGWMIEQCGWKGKSLGPAGVHHKQALVLVNKGNAKGADIVRLCKQIQEDVFAKFGIRISPEVNII